MKHIIVTVGPSFFAIDNITQIHNDRYIYRINGAHGTLDSIKEYVNHLRKHIPKAQILIDLPGNKVRTFALEQPIEIREGEHFSLKSSNLNYPQFSQHLKKNDIVYANDSIFKFTVEKIEDNQNIIFLSHSNGVLLNNKGMHVRGIHDQIPFLFDRDLQLIQMANELQIDYIGLSFVRNIDDIRLARQKIKNSHIICKIETKKAVENINEILDESDFFLIDRGDLSTEIGLLELARYQRYIIEKAMQKNKKLFLATQFLKNMEHNPLPSIAEAIDLINTLKMGIFGIQLSEETAVGKYPLKCLEIIEEAQYVIINEGI